SSLLTIGGRENAQKVIRYAGMMHDLIERAEPPTGKDIVQRQEERERARGRALIYQSRAYTVLGETEEPARLASLAFTAYPNQQSARHWGEALAKLGREREAMTY